MASGEYLLDDAKFNVQQLIEPIRKASVIRKVAPIQTVIDPSDNQVEIDTLTDDFHITMDLEVTQEKRSSQYLTQNSYTVGLIQGLLQYDWDTFQRIQNSKQPVSKRVMDLGTHIADHEDAFALAVSTTGLRDGDAKPLLENGTSTAFLTDSYANLKSSMATYIGTLAGTFGNLKKYPLKFVYNTAFLQEVLGLSNATTDDDGIMYLDRQLKMYGGMGSEAIHSERVGCAITVAQDEITITNEADPTCAIMVYDRSNYSVYNSVLDPRPGAGGTNKDTGYKNKIIEKWFPFVHRATSILYDINTSP